MDFDEQSQHKEGFPRTRCSNSTNLAHVARANELVHARYTSQPPVPSPFYDNAHSASIGVRPPVGIHREERVALGVAARRSADDDKCLLLDRCRLHGRHLAERAMQEIAIVMAVGKATMLAPRHANNRRVQEVLLRGFGCGCVTYPVVGEPVALLHRDRAGSSACKKKLRNGRA
jgi:hypothetical protein